MPDLILALDIGTTSLSAVIFTPGGELKALASTPVQSVSERPGQVEQDAASLVRSTREVIDAALARARASAADLAAIGVTSQRASIVCWDRVTGRPLAPVVVWSDLRGAARATELQQAGYMVMPQQAAAKLEGVVAGIADRSNLAWGNVDAWIIWNLSRGQVHATDRSQAWPMGYLDLATLGWNEGLMQHQGLDPASFPELVDTWGVMGPASALGAEVPIAAVVADQQSALIGHGCEAAGAGKVTYGTSATLNVSTGDELKFVNMTTPPFVLSSVSGRTRFCLEGMVITAGSAFDWFRRTFGIEDHAEFERLAEETPDAAGAWFLPSLQGLGAPHGDFSRKGSIGGLATATTAGHLVRAAVDGLACRVREAFDAVYDGAGLTRPEALRVDGGMTNSDALMQAQADILGLPVQRHALREATAAGAAICAARGVGLLGPEETANFATYDRTYEPRLSPEEALARFDQWKANAYG
ncbi:MAG: FGGY family carbohydrate kinase [Parcubacteria group bacterium]